MNCICRVLLRSALAIGLTASPVSAAPVTFAASGNVSTLGDTFGVLDPLAPGTAWALNFTFDGETPTTSLGCGGSAFLYAGAIKQTTFEIGGFVYSNSGGDIYTNYALPIGACGAPFDSLGLVQFQWQRGWTVASGAPDLNGMLGLLLASYVDSNSLGGALPGVPQMHPTQSPFSGLEWDGLIGGGPITEQFTSDFRPAAPVPEPGTFALLGTGILFIVRRRTSQRRS